MSQSPLRKSVLALGIALIAVSFGCQPAEDDDTPAQTQNQVNEKTQTVRLLSLDDSQQLAARVAQVWKAQSTGDVEITYAESTTLFADESGTIPECDVVLYPNVLLGELLARQAVQPLDVNILSELGADRRAMLRHDRTTVVQSGKAIYGASLGTPMLMLLYRRDVLEQLKLEVPQSWRQYREAKDALKSAGELKSPDGKPLPTGVCEPNAETWLAEYFFARAAGSLVRQGRLSSYFDVESMKSLINTPPFVDALEQIVAEHSLQNRDEMTPSDCYEAIVKGEAAFAITWPSSQPTIESVAEVFPIGVAALPGAARVYDYREQIWKLSPTGEVHSTPLVPIAGRIASITSNTRRLKTAQRFVAWLMTAEANREFSTEFPDTLFAQSAQLSSPFAWVNEQLPREAAQQMADVIRSNHEHSFTMYNLRIPGRAEYLRILSEAIRSALNGRATPQSALDSAAEQWDALTDKLDRDRQRKFFQDSIRLSIMRPRTSLFLVDGRSDRKRWNAKPNAAISKGIPEFRVQTLSAITGPGRGHIN